MAVPIAQTIFVGWNRVKVSLDAFSGSLGVVNMGHELGEFLLVKPECP